MEREDRKIKMVVLYKSYTLPIHIVLPKRITKGLPYVYFYTSTDKFKQNVHLSKIRTLIQEHNRRRYIPLKRYLGYGEGKPRLWLESWAFFPEHRLTEGILVRAMKTYVDEVVNIIEGSFYTFLSYGDGESAMGDNMTETEARELCIKLFEDGFGTQSRELFRICRNYRDCSVAENVVRDATVASVDPDVPKKVRLVLSSIMGRVCKETCEATTSNFSELKRISVDACVEALMK